MGERRRLFGFFPMSYLLAFNFSLLSLSMQTDTSDIPLDFIYLLFPPPFLLHTLQLVVLLVRKTAKHRKYDSGRTLGARTLLGVVALSASAH